jgi:hypothetical protein
MIEVIEEVPYGSRDISNVDTDISIPISVEVFPHKVYLIEDNLSHSGAYLNFQTFRLSENRINRERESSQNLIKKVKCILYTMVSIPITILLLGYVSTTWNRR